MVDFINNICRYIFINISTLYVFSHSINFSNKNKNFMYYFSTIIFSIFIAFLYTILIQKLDSLSTLIILCLILGIENSILTNNKIYYSIIVTTLSIAISLSVFVISIFITSMILKISLMFEMPISEIRDEHPIFLLGTIIISMVIFYKLFKIKRFKNGFAFLKQADTIDTFGGVVIIFCGIVLTIYSLLGNHMTLYDEHLLIGLSLTSIRFDSMDKKAIKLLLQRQFKRKNNRRIRK